MCAGPWSLIAEAAFFEDARLTPVRKFLPGIGKERVFPGIHAGFRGRWALGAEERLDHAARLRLDTPAASQDVGARRRGRRGVLRALRQADRPRRAVGPRPRRRPLWIPRAVASGLQPRNRRSAAVAPDERRLSPDEERAARAYAARLVQPERKPR